MAAILKSNAPVTVGDAQRSVSGLTNFNLQDIVETGRRQLEGAKAESDRMLAEAKLACEQIKKQAFDAGRREGIEAGQKEIQEQIQQTAKKLAENDLATFRAALNQLHQNEQEWLERWRGALVGLVMELTERLVVARSEKDEQVVAQWAQQAIELTKSARSITIAVHPETLVRIGDRLEALLRSSGAPVDSRLEPDESVSIHGVVVRQEGGFVDLQLKSQLERFAQRLQ